MPIRSQTSANIPEVLEIPALWDHDWHEAHEQATEGVEQDIVLVQARGAHLLKDIEDRTFSFARLAWLCLWARAFWLLDAARKSLNARSEYTLELLARATFELCLQVEAISERTPDDRLRAYAAWCLANDIRYQQEFVHPKTLDAIWSAEPAQSILANKRQLDVYQKFFGPLTIDVDETTRRRGRFRQQDQERHRLHRLKSWLAHTELASWKQRLDDLAQRRKPQPTIFEVLNESEKSVRSRLLSRLGPAAEFMYLSYSKGSMFMHGSTIEQLIAFHDQGIGPRLLVEEERCESLARRARTACNVVFVLLGVLQRRVWGEGRVDGERN